ncbi:unnamed protein product, partial [Iphiclides podalirius]
MLRRRVTSRHKRHILSCHRHRRCHQRCDRCACCLSDGTPYKVMTPFWSPVPIHQQIQYAAHSPQRALDLQLGSV